jgi:cell division protein FtsB
MELIYEDVLKRYGKNIAELVMALYAELKALDARIAQLETEMEQLSS